MQPHSPKHRKDVSLKLLRYTLVFTLYGEEVPSASDNDITELEEKINQFVTISQEKDANLDKTMRLAWNLNINKSIAKRNCQCTCEIRCRIKTIR